MTHRVGAVPVPPPPVRGQEHRPLGAFAESIAQAVRGASGMVTILPP